MPPKHPASLCESVNAVSDAFKQPKLSMQHTPPYLQITAASPARGPFSRYSGSFQGAKNKAANFHLAFSMVCFHQGHTESSQHMSWASFPLFLTLEPFLLMGETKATAKGTVLRMAAPEISPDLA